MNTIERTQDYYDIVNKNQESKALQLRRDIRELALEGLSINYM